MQDTVVLGDECDQPSSSQACLPSFSRSNSTLCSTETTGGARPPGEAAATGADEPEPGGRHNLAYSAVMEEVESKSQVGLLL